MIIGEFLSNGRSIEEQPGLLRRISSAGQWFGLMALAGVAYNLLRQQGELLLRLDQLEAQLSASAAPAPSPRDDVVVGDRNPGIEVTGEVPAFSLPDVEGTTVSSEELRGRRLMLVHWDPLCGFCESIAGQLASLETDLERRKTDLVLISRGKREDNLRVVEQSGLRSRLLLEDESDPPEVFTRLGTPAAYLVDERGRVARPLALGADAVLELAEQVAHGRNRLRTERPLSESRIEREGLAAGTVAPAFALTDLGGRTVGLEDYRGRCVLVVFSDPDCGPCNALLPRLVQMTAGAPEAQLSVLLISRGDLDKNRHKAAEHGVGFPVLIQPGWQVSREYGIFSTPVAFLVSEDGVIARDVARGAEEILQVAAEALSSGARRESRRLRRRGRASASSVLSA